LAAVAHQPSPIPTPINMRHGTGVAFALSQSLPRLRIKQINHTCCTACRQFRAVRAKRNAQNTVRSMVNKPDLFEIQRINNKNSTTVKSHTN
jgi:hypothetical protein